MDVVALQLTSCECGQSVTATCTERNSAADCLGRGGCCDTRHASFQKPEQAGLARPVSTQISPRYLLVDYFCGCLWAKSSACWEPSCAATMAWAACALTVTAVVLAMVHGGEANKNVGRVYAVERVHVHVPVACVGACVCWCISLGCLLNPLIAVAV